MRYRVYGAITLAVDVLVEADDEESAVEAAYETWPGIGSFIGNGPYQDETDANVWEGGEPEFTSAEEEE